MSSTPLKDDTATENHHSHDEHDEEDHNSRGEDKGDDDFVKVFVVAEGMSTDAAAMLLEQWGRNELEEKETPKWFVIKIEELFFFLFVCLFVCNEWFFPALLLYCGCRSHSRDLCSQTHPPLSFVRVFGLTVWHFIVCLFLELFYFIFCAS
jgi:hypothetical protein